MTCCVECLVDGRKKKMVERGVIRFNCDARVPSLSECRDLTLYRKKESRERSD